MFLDPSLFRMVAHVSFKGQYERVQQMLRTDFVGL